MKALITLLWTIFTFLNSCVNAGEWLTTEDGTRFYVENKLKVTWFAAITECTQLNMSLISMDSPTKTQEVKNLIETNNFGSGTPYFWIGGHEHNVSRHFEWITTGEAFNYTNWESSQPNDVDQHCVWMYSRESYSWYDYDCNDKNGFVCEETPLQKVTKTESALTNDPSDNQTNLLKEKTEELDSLKKKLEKITRESLEQMKQKQEELVMLQKSSEQQMALLNHTQTELNALKTQISSDAEIKQMLKDIQENQLKNQNQIIDRLAKCENTKNSEVFKASGNESISNAISYETQAALLKAKSEELEALKITNKEWLVALQKSYEVNINRTATNKYYTIFPNLNKNSN